MFDFSLKSLDAVASVSFLYFSYGSYMIEVMRKSRGKISFINNHSIQFLTYFSSSNLAGTIPIQHRIFGSLRVNRCTYDLSFSRMEVR